MKLFNRIKMDMPIEKEFSKDPSLIFSIRNDLFYLLIALGLLLFLPAFIPIDIHKNVATYILLTIASGAGVVSLSTTRRKFNWGIGIAIACLLFGILGLTLADPGLVLLLRTFGFILLFSYVSIGVLTRVSRSEKISTNILYGSIAGYLLMGLLGGFWCFLLNFLYPGSFMLPEESSPTLNTLTYFSFVTMTTVGYGEITPQTEPAKAVALFIAIVGQMYMTINIAILVSKYVARQS